jgi:hypothetical protein
MRHWPEFLEEWLREGREEGRALKRCGAIVMKDASLPTYPSLIERLSRFCNIHQNDGSCLAKQG